MSVVVFLPLKRQDRQGTGHGTYIQLCALNIRTEPGRRASALNTTGVLEKHIVGTHGAGKRPERSHRAIIRRFRCPFHANCGASWRSSGGKYMHTSPPECLWKSSGVPIPSGCILSAILSALLTGFKNLETFADVRVCENIQKIEKWAQMHCSRLLRPLNASFGPQFGENEAGKTCFSGKRPLAGINSDFAHPVRTFSAHSCKKVMYCLSSAFRLCAFREPPGAQLFALTPDSVRRLSAHS